MSFQLGPWLIEPSLNRARLNGTVVQLEPKIMQVRLTKLLHEMAGEALSVVSGAVTLILVLMGVRQRKLLSIRTPAAA